MGVDATIRFKVKEGNVLPDLSFLESRENHLYIEEVDKEASEDGETHEFYTLMRYYGVGYERGPFPLLLKIILYLMENEAIEKVWYGGDSYVEEMTSEKVSSLVSHWISNGTRPYHKR